MQQLHDILSEADGYLVVSAEYNHSIPPALSNLLNHFLGEYMWKPAGIACYSVGSFGGVRAAMQLRAMLPELGATSIPSLLPFPRVGEVFDESGELVSEQISRSMNRFLDEFEWYCTAMLKGRETGTPY